MAEFTPDPIAVATLTRSGADAPRVSLLARILRQTPVLLSVVLSVVSIATSTYTLITTNAIPPMRLVLPTSIRIYQPVGSDAVVYIQPAFVDLGAGSQTVVISDLRLSLQAPGSSFPVTFTWESFDTLTDIGTGTTIDLQFHWAGDPHPMVVGPDQPQVPLVEFDGPAGLTYSAGAYLATLTAPRVGGAALVQTFTFTLTSSDATFWVLHPTNFLTIPILASNQVT